MLKPSSSPKARCARSAEWWTAPIALKTSAPSRAAARRPARPRRRRSSSSKTAPRCFSMGNHQPAPAPARSWRYFGQTHLSISAFAHGEDWCAARCAVLLLLILKALAKAGHAVPMRTVFGSHRILTGFCKIIITLLTSSQVQKTFCVDRQWPRG